MVDRYPADQPYLPPAALPASPTCPWTATVPPRSSRGARLRPWPPGSAGCSRGWRVSSSTSRCRHPACPSDRVAPTVRAVGASRRAGASRGRLDVGVARVVAAGVVRGVGVRAAVRLRAGEDVVLVRHVADAVDDRPASRSARSASRARCRCVPARSCRRGDRRRSGDESAARVEPRTVADAVTRVDRARTLRAQVGVPDHRRTAAGRRAHRLAVRVGAGQAAVVGAVALADAGDEERHRLWRSATSRDPEHRRPPAPAPAARSRCTNRGPVPLTGR